MADGPLRDWSEVWDALMGDVPGWDASTLRALGERAGCDAGTVSRVRRGVGAVSVDTVARVLEAAGASPGVISRARVLLGEVADG